MSLRIKSLNSDSSFLLVFSPPYAPHNPQGTFPGSFTILLDPWLSGPSKVWSEKFALTTHNVAPCVESLAELPEPDLVIISQEKTDHCHQETLQQLPSDTPSLILGTPSAARKIKSWKYFDHSDRIVSLKSYNDRKPESVFRIPIKPLSSSGSAGEVTVSLLTSKMDVTGLHNAIGITYRPPSSVLSAQVGTYVDLPPTPPASPPASVTSSTTTSSPMLPASTTVFPPPFGNREKTLSVIYSPHGVDYNAVKTYASSHLIPQGALPLTALLHSFNRLLNPWYMGGTVCAGYPSGIEIASNLFAKAWVSAHDEEKTNSGVAVMGLKVYKAELDEVNAKLLSFQKGACKDTCNTFLRSLGAGEEHFIPAK